MSAAPSARSRLRAVLTMALLAALGGGLAAAYAYFVGCRTGTCPITSNVWTAGLYGALVGGVIGWPGRRDAREARAAGGAAGRSPP